MKTHAATPHYATGIVLFGSNGQLLFMNHEAQAYIRLLHSSAAKENRPCLIPEEILVVVRELQCRLQQSDYAKENKAIQVEHRCLALQQRLLLRGFCVPDEPLVTSSRLMVIIENVDQKVECPAGNAQQRYHLTEREQMVVIYLMLGFTNKEIAHRLNISEYTVKEHLKRIMQKTKTTTRTGLLSRMIFAAPDGLSTKIGGENY